MLKASILFSLVLVAPQMIEARTVSVEGLVTKSSGLVQLPDGTVLAHYPAIGSIGALTYTLGENDMGSVDPTTSFLLGIPFESLPVTATATVGSFAGGIIPNAPDGETEMESVYSDTSLARFSTRSVGLGDLGETFAGGLRFTFSPELASAPTTWEDLFAAIDDGNALASLSWNGTIGGMFIEFEMIQTEPAPIPLPGGGPLLIAGVAGLALLRRKSRTAAPHL